MSQTSTKYSRETGLNLGLAKVPPQAKEIEEAVLGTILTVPAIIESAMESLTEEVFYVSANQKIFSACVKLNTAHKQTDILSVMQQLKNDGLLDEIGGAFYLSKLTEKTSSGSFENWCGILLEKFIRRELIKLNGESLNECYDESLEIFDVLDTHEKNFGKITQNITKERIYSIGELILPALNKIAKLRLNDTHITGVSSGIKLLDKITRGWQPSDLIILAARPAMGKTAFALRLAINAAKNGTPVYFFSLEMSKQKLVNRIISSESGIDLFKIESGRLTDEEYLIIEKTSDKISKFPLFIDDTASLNIFEFRAKVRRARRKNKIGLVVVDYLQLMAGHREKNSNREQEISSISRNMKILAKDLDIPIIALSQLSRAVETRKENKLPQLSDLRESGAIEQDADLVMFLYRLGYYEKVTSEGESCENDALIKIAKHRNGSLDEISLKVDLAIQMFYDPFDYEELNRNKHQSKFIPIGKNFYETDNDDNLF